MNAASEFVTDGKPKVDGPDPRGRRYTPGLSDGLGERVLLFDPETSSSYELLRFRREFSDMPGFEAALRASVEELLRFHHPSFSDVSSVEYLGPGEGIALVSHHVAGRRLSEILTKAKGPVFARELVQQLTPALAALHDAVVPAVSHGLLTPERIAVTREGRLVILEHVVGSAIETLRLPARRLRSELGIAIESTDAPVISHRADIIQLALISLSLLIGRRVDAADYPADIVPLIDEAVAGDPAALRLRPWLERALQLTTPAFASAADALVALKELPDESQDGSKAPVALMSLRAPLRPFSAASLDAVPVAVESVAAKPIVLETVVVEPAATKPIAAKPVVAKPIVATPAVAKVAVAEPVVEQPAVVQPIVVEPAVETRAAAKSILEPVAAEPVVKAPLVADPVVVKPVVAADPVAAPMRPAAQAEPPAAKSKKIESLFEAVPEIEPAAPTRKISWATVGLAGLSVAQAVVIAALIYIRPASGIPTIVVASPGAPAATPLGLAASPLSPADALGGPALGAAAAMPLASPAGQPDVPAKTETPAASREATSGPRFGGISLSSPIDVQIFEGGRLVGSTTGGPIALAEGTHAVEAVNETLGFRSRLTIDVKAGQMTTVNITAPNGRLSVNATPWATVTLNGRVLGDTPLANLSVPIGHHEIVFRNPEFGEQRQTVAVKTEGLTRVSANFQR